MKTSAVLQSALNLLGEHGENWTTGSFARNERGLPVSISSPSATCYCAAGAVYRVGTRDNVNINQAMYALEKSARSGIGFYNDSYDFTGVRRLFERCIGKALKEEAA